MSDPQFDPIIELVEDKWLRVCNCCGRNDGTVLSIVMGHADRVIPDRPIGNKNTVAACLSCRLQLRSLLLKKDGW